jgi:hypothetical protein
LAAIAEIDLQQQAPMLGHDEIGERQGMEK